MSYFQKILTNPCCGSSRNSRVRCKLRCFSTTDDFEEIAKALCYCGKIRNVKYGASLHCQVIKTGLRRNILVGNHLIGMYCRFSFINDGQKVFDEMSERNVVSWTTLISAYANLVHPDESLRIFNEMLEYEIPNGFTYSVALKSCALSKNIRMGKSIHESIIRNQLHYDVVLMNSLMDMYVKCGNLDDAQKVFDSTTHPNLTSWNILLSGYAQEGHMEDAMNILYQIPTPDIISWNTIVGGFASIENPRAIEFVKMMHQLGFQLDEFTFPCALKICGLYGFKTRGEQLHCYLIRSGPGCFIGSALVDMYMNCGAILESVKVFNEYLGYRSSIQNRLTLWNSIISGYIKNKQNAMAIQMIRQLHVSGMKFPSMIFSSILKLCINLISMRLGSQVHGLIVVSEHNNDSILGSMLIDLYSKCGQIEDSLRLFQELPVKDCVAWSGIISGCSRQGLSSLALSLFKQMLNLKVEVDEYIVSSSLKSCSSLAWLECGRELHGYCIKFGYESDRIVLTSLIDMYTNCGKIDDGITLFQSLPAWDTVCWTGIISGCGRNGRGEEAIRLFKEMLNSGVNPNGSTFLAVLSACKYSGLIKEAQSIMKLMELKHRCALSLDHYSCMVDFLSQAGHFEEAEKIIEDMPYDPNESTWRSLLGGCEIHKNVEVAKRASEKLLAMSPQNVSTHVTLSNVYATLGMWDESNHLRNIVRQVRLKDAGRSWIEVRS